MSNNLLYSAGGGDIDQRIIYNFAMIFYFGIDVNLNFGLPLLFVYLRKKYYEIEENKNWNKGNNITLINNERYVILFIRNLVFICYTFQDHKQDNETEVQEPTGDSYSTVL